MAVAVRKSVNQRYSEAQKSEGYCKNSHEERRGAMGKVYVSICILFLI